MKTSTSRRSMRTFHIYRDIKSLNIETGKMEVTERKTEIRKYDNKRQAQCELDRLAAVAAASKGWKTKLYTNTLLVDKYNEGVIIMKFYIR